LFTIVNNKALDTIQLLEHFFLSLTILTIFISKGDDTHL